jgi:predicted RNA-binding Zn-ribbon protein involved in translation (DUF1610 family)
VRNGRCPTCGSTTIRAARNGLQLGENYAIGIRPHRAPDEQGVFRAHRTEDIWAFVCTTCGALELYVIDEQALAFIRERWVEVPPTG